VVLQYSDEWRVASGEWRVASGEILWWLSEVEASGVEAGEEWRVGWSRWLSGAEAKEVQRTGAVAASWVLYTPFFFNC